MSAAPLSLSLLWSRRPAYVPVGVLYLLLADFWLIKLAGFGMWPAFSTFGLFFAMYVASGERPFPMEIDRPLALTVSLFFGIFCLNMLLGAWRIVFNRARALCNPGFVPDHRLQPLPLDWLQAVDAAVVCALCDPLIARVAHTAGALGRGLFHQRTAPRRREPERWHGDPEFRRIRSGSGQLHALCGAGVTQPRRARNCAGEPAAPAALALPADSCRWRRTSS